MGLRIGEDGRVVVSAQTDISNVVRDVPCLTQVHRQGSWQVLVDQEAFHLSRSVHFLTG